MYKSIYSSCSFCILCTLPYFCFLTRWGLCHSARTASSRATDQPKGCSFGQVPSMGLASAFASLTTCWTLSSSPCGGLPSKLPATIPVVLVQTAQDALTGLPARPVAAVLALNVWLFDGEIMISHPCTLDSVMIYYMSNTSQKETVSPRGRTSAK